MIPKCCMCRKSIKSGEHYYIMQGRTTCIECGKKFNSTKSKVLNVEGKMKRTMSNEKIIKNLKIMNEAIDWDIPIDADTTTKEAIEIIKNSPDFDCTLRD